jgi:hypothetical protein
MSPVCVHSDAFLNGFCGAKREPRFVAGVLYAMYLHLDLPRGTGDVFNLLTNDASFEKRLEVELVLLATPGDKDTSLHDLHLEFPAQLVFASALALVAHDQGVTLALMTPWQLVQGGGLVQRSLYHARLPLSHSLLTKVNSSYTRPHRRRSGSG